MFLVYLLIHLLFWYMMGILMENTLQNKRIIDRLQIFGKFSKLLSFKLNLLIPGLPFAMLSGEEKTIKALFSLIFFFLTHWYFHITFYLLK